MKKQWLLLLVLVIAAGFTTCEDPNSPAKEITYTISFDANGGTGGPANKTVAYGKALPTLNPADKPENEGFYFTGYFDEEVETEETLQYYNSELAAAQPKWDRQNDATLYAQWSSIPVYTISFNANGGTGSMQALQVPENTAVDLPANTFTRTGYTFAGWAETAAGEAEYDDEDNYEMGTAAATLYAFWTAKTYTINFNTNGGTGGQSAPVTATFGQPMPTISGTPAKDGSVFTGYWDAASNGTQYYYEDLSSAKNWDKDESSPVTLYAQFEVPVTPAIVSLVQSETVAQADDFTYLEILALTREAITLAGGLDGIVESGDIVVLKPNIVCAFYNWGSGGSGVPMLVNGVGTDWRVIQAVATIVREIVGPYDSGTGKGKIMLIEGPATGNSATNHFNVMGWTTANLTEVDEIIGLESEGTYKAGGSGTDDDYNKLITLNDYVYTTPGTGSWQGASPYSTYYKGDGKYYVNKKMYNADALISIPVVKSHSNAVVTGGIKNISIGAAPTSIYGISSTVLGRNGMVNHASNNLHAWIADYFACIPADFVVMDGLQGLQNGPGAGANLNALRSNQKNLRSMLASRDPLAIDIVETNMIGWDYTSVPYLTYLTERGQVGPKTNGRTIPLRGNPKDIVVVGNRKVDDVRGTYSGNMGAGNVGDRISAENQAKPTVTINSAAFSGQNLNMSLALSNGANNKVVKIDIYIDGKYTASSNSNMANVSLDTTGLAAGSHNVEVRAYTKYMYSETATRTVTKQ